MLCALMGQSAIVCKPYGIATTSARRLYLHASESLCECDVQKRSLWPWIYACPKFAGVGPDTRADKIFLINVLSNTVLTVIRAYKGTTSCLWSMYMLVSQLSDKTSRSVDSPLLCCFMSMYS